MRSAVRVYELDVEEVIVDLIRALRDRGVDVVEQVPAGVWWFRTKEDQASVCRQLTDVFQDLVRDRLREVPQEG